MSSDSELEEFFDAEDVTPKHSFLESVEENVSPDNLEMEERALLVLKKRQEKRRQKEDHDLEMRLHSLILKRKEEKERILEQDRKEQLERRRRRHEELRRRITKKGDDSNESTSSTSESDESDLEIDSPDGIRVALPPDCKTLNNTPPREKDDFSVNINRSLPEKEKKQKQINDLFDSTDTLDDNMSDPDKIAEAVALQNFLIVDGNEPDIVKSTKTRTPPNTLQAAVDPMPVSSQVGEPVYSQQQQPGQKQQQQNQSTGTFVEPVAPPRRKKKLKMTLGDVNNSENPCPRSSAVSLPADFVIEPASPGLPSETMTLGSSMERLELDLEQSLDLHSIIVGKKHINAEDAEMEAINSDQDSPRQTLEALSSKSSKTSSLERSFMDEKKGSKTSTLDRLSEDGKKSKGSTLDRSSQDGKKSKGSTLDRSSQDGKKSKGSTLDRSSRDGKKSKGSSLDRSSQDGKKSKGSTLDSSSQDGKKSKGSSLERSSQDGKIRKGSSLDRSSQDGRKSKGSSLDRPDEKKSKSSSLDTAEGKGSRASSLDKAELRRKHGSGRDSLPKHSGRPLSSSGKPLTDEEILGTFVVRNLDTGETTTLKDAEKEIEKCIDPLILHLMQRSKDLPRVEGLDKDEEDTRSEGGKSLSSERLRKKGAKLKRFIGKKVGRTVTKVKTAADQVMHGEENTVIEEEVSDDGRRFKFKANHNKKGPYDFGKIKLVQDLGGEHTGAIWTMKFSPCGRLLATGGQDCVLRIWVLESAYNYFDDMRQKYIEMEVSPAPSQESLGSIPSISETSSLDLGATAETEDVKKGPFRGKPFCKYRGHTADLLDTSWSKNYFILSSSMDKTVRLWHISRRECLCTFQHVDFVTAIVFHPKDDRYFLSGSLDGKLRLWNIPDKKVTLWNEVGGGNSSLITTANFCHNGKFAVVGTYDGKCIFFNTEHLKYYTQIHVRSTRGKNARGQKITGIEPLVGEDKVLVTSNDSRVRLYDLRDLTLTCKYKGPMNTSSQIRASFSPKGRYVISGSEDHFIYLWRTQHEFYKFSSARRDRNDYYEAVKVHNAVVTAAIFAPHPSHFVPSDDVSCKDKDASENQSQFIVSADFLGSIKVIKAK